MLSERAISVWAAMLAGIVVNGICLLSPAAFGQDNSTPPAIDASAGPIGKVVSVTGKAQIEHSAAVLVQANLPSSDGQPKAGDLVFRGDIIQTGVGGGMSIAFSDGTSFTISPNARMEVNEFIYDPKGNANSSLLSLTKGTFTFIAGAVAHSGDMKVDTPVGTLGIRGTAPRVEILEDGTVKLSTLIEAK